MHYISNAATRFNLKVATDAEKMQADSWHPANREAGIACRHLLLTTATQQLGLTRTLQHAPEVGLQVHQQDCGKNYGPTVDVNCSVDQSENQDWIRIERGSKEGTQTQHCHATHTHGVRTTTVITYILHIASLLHTGIDM